MSTEHPNLLRSEIHGTFDTGILGSGTLETRITGLVDLYPTGQRQNDHMYSHIIQELNKKLDTFGLTGNIVQPVDAGFRPLNITGFFTPSGPSYSTRSLNYFNAVEAAGGSFDLTSFDPSYTEDYVKSAHNDLFTGIESYADNIGQLVLFAGKTFPGIAVPAIGFPMTSINLVSGSYNPVNPTGAATIGLEASSSSAFLQLTNQSDNTGVLPVSSKDNYSLVTVMSAAAGTYSTAIEYYENSAANGYIASQHKYDSLRFYYGRSFTESLTYSAGVSEYDDLTDYWTFQKNSFVGVMVQANQSPVVLTTSLNSSTYTASGSATSNGIDWRFGRGGGLGRFPICMVVKDNATASLVRPHIKTFLEAFGDNTISA